MATFLLLERLAQHRRLLRLIGLAHLLGVAAGRLGLLGLLGVDLDEGRAQRLHLLLDRRSHVVAGDHGAEAPRRRDRLQAGHAHAHHDDARRRHRARRRHHHGKGTAELHRGVEHRLVARQVRLGGEHVHGLGARDARHELHGEGRDAGRRVGRQALVAAVGCEHADEKGAALHEGELAAPVRRLERPLDLEHDVGIAERLCGVRGEPGAGLDVGLVAEGGPFAGAALDRDLEAEGDELLHRVRRRGDAPLVLVPLLGDGDLHVETLSPAPAARHNARSPPLCEAFVGECSARGAPT